MHIISSSNEIKCNISSNKEIKYKAKIQTKMDP
jgi:hypothetical protein